MEIDIIKQTHVFLAMSPFLQTRPHITCGQGVVKIMPPTYLYRNSLRNHLWELTHEEIATSLVLPQEALKWRCFSVLDVLQARKHYVRTV